MYIVGIDIAKRFHEAAIIDRAGNIVVKRIKFANSHAGFLKFMEAVHKLDAPAEFGMETTGHYWLPLYAHLRQAEQTVHVINPLQSDALRSMFIRQTNIVALRERCRQRYVCHKILAIIFAVLRDNKPYFPASTSWLFIAGLVFAVEVFFCYHDKNFLGGKFYGKNSCRNYTTRRGGTPSRY